MEAWPFTEEVTEYLRKAERTELGRWGRKMGFRMCLAGFVTNKASKTRTAWGQKPPGVTFYVLGQTRLHCEPMVLSRVWYISPICCYHMWSWPSHMHALTHIYHRERWTHGICAMCFDLETCCYSSHPFLPLPHTLPASALKYYMYQSSLPMYLFMDV